MNKPVFRVVGLDQATCGEQYSGAETTTQPNTATMLPAQYSVMMRSELATVRVRLGDVLPVLQASSSARLAWVQDFKDDPVVITKDLYDVLITYQRMKNAA